MNSRQSSQRHFCVYLSVLLGKVALSFVGVGSVCGSRQCLHEELLLEPVTCVGQDSPFFCGEVAVPTEAT